MARAKYDVRGVAGGGSRAIPAGTYNAKITQADITKPDGKDQRIEVIMEVVNDSDHNGAKLYEYINMESEAARWKLREFLEACSIVKNKKSESGTLDTDRDCLNKIIGIKTYIRPADDARGFDEQSRVRRMWALDGDEATAEAEDLDADAEPDAEAEDSGEWSWDDIADLDRAGLKKINKDEDLKVKVVKSMTDDELREAIADALEIPQDEEEPEEAEDEAEDEEEEGEEEGDDEATDEAESDLDNMSLAEVRTLAKSLDIDTKGLKRNAIEAAIREARETAAEDEEGEVDDYDEWSDDDLKEELTQRSLSVKGSKKTLIARLRKDDAEEDKPF